MSGNTCGGGTVRDDYNLSLHVGSLFLILAVSFSACAFPLMVVKVPALRIPPTFLFIVRHFGTGVLVATAFVHLLPTAFISLTDPCLPKFWNQDYPAMAGAIALAAVFMIAVIEMIFSPGRNCCSIPPEMMTAITTAPVRERRKSCDISDAPAIRQGPTQSFYSQGLIHSRPHSTSRELSRIMAFQQTVTTTPRKCPICFDEEAARPLEAILPTVEDIQPVEEKDKEDLTETPSQIDEKDSRVPPTMQQRRLLLQCLMLELGILFHSVFIGMALAVSTGDDFIILLIAISFHQMFEGLALGSRIATVEWHAFAPWRQKYQPWLMALAYGLTTPLGMALGIATHTLYDPASMTGLLMVGIMNAISAGLLVFASLIDLMSEDFLSEESWKTLRGKRRVTACCLVFAGAFGMSLIGAWA